jgi:type IV pilus assembly protein PilA
MTARHDGFTLVELLVVIIIIAILAAVAVPVFLAQREKGYAAQVQAALKNASTAVEAYATDNEGDYSGLDSAPDLTAVMLANGYVVPSWASTFDVTASATAYCIEIRHASLERDSPWRRATYFGSNGTPSPSPDVCPAAPSL